MITYPMNPQLMDYSSMADDVVLGIPAHVSEKDLEETVIFVLSDIQVNASPNNVEECHRIVKPGGNK